jgi:outer membrane protein assembly factor BamB
MNQSTGAFAALFLAAAAASAQDLPRVHTHPTVPAADALQRLNLKLGWRTYIPMDGQRDSIFSVQNAGDILLLQTRSGLVCAVDSETGRLRWQARVGRPYHVSVRLGFNTDAVYVVNDQTLFVLDRQTGARQFEFDMPSAVTTAPVADNDQVFLSLQGGKVSAYQRPRVNPDLVAKSTGTTKKEIEQKEQLAKKGGSGVGLTSSIGAMTSATGKGTRTLSSIGAMTSARQATERAKVGFGLRLDWSDNSGLRLEVPAVQTDDSLLLVDATGRVAGLAKGIRQSVHYNYRLADGQILVPPGQYGEEVYIASQDSNLYAVRVPTGSVQWRFTAGTPILYRPAVTDDDIYITAERGGLIRLDRGSGREVWRNSAADRFLAVNPKVVYAADRTGRLLMLDRARGTQIATFDMRDFVIRPVNDMTDRVYLAANDGLLVCMHDRDYAKPYPSKKVEAKKPDKKRGDRMKATAEDEPKPRAKPKPEDTEGDEDKGDEPKAKPKAKPDDKQPDDDKDNQPKAKPRDKKPGDDKDKEMDKKP